MVVRGVSMYVCTCVQVTEGLRKCDSNASSQCGVMYVWFSYEW